MRARILSPTPENIAQAAAALQRGEVVGMPTETVYGLAGAALRPEALALIFDTKERPTFDPLIVHVGFAAKGLYPLEHARLIDPKPLSELARGRAEKLIQAFWPGPLTLVLPKHADVPDLATSGLPSVALRMPAHRVAQMLIAASGLALAAPSANRFGRISPTTAQAVAEELGDRIDWILDGGACDIGVESTVVRVENDGALTLLRPGGLSRARIEEVAGCALQLPGAPQSPATTPQAASTAPQAASTAPQAASTAPQASPGMLESHYAPRKALYLLPGPLHSLSAADWERVRARANGARLGFLLMQDTLAAAPMTATPPDAIVLTLSRDGDLTEIARGLFARMRELDASAAELLFAEPCAIDRGLGHAIADRLGRAARGKL